MSPAPVGLLRSAPQLDAALHRFVDEHGMVDYAAVQADGTIEASARELEHFDLSALENRAEKLAFWINAYNSLVLAGVLAALKRDPQTTSVAAGGWLGVVRFFYLKRYSVGGKQLSLATIENRILRKELREPRVHFALVCAATSCPPLKQGLYAAERIEAELDSAARLFILSPIGVLVEPETHTLWLSRIFKWYHGDFERAAGSVLSYVTPYLSVGDQAYLERHRPQVRLRYFGYDWRLNRRS